MKILIVDDSNFVLNNLYKTITNEMNDVDVIRAENGLMGYELYLKEKPNVIITDLLMPVMNGQEFIAKVREIDKEIGIIVASADVQVATREEVNALGITGFINKPIKADKVDAFFSLLKEALNVK